MSLSPTTRHRLAVQGFAGADPEQLAQVAPWLRFAPALCGGFALAGTVLASPSVLWALAGTAVLGAILPHHPFEYAYQWALRHAVRRPPLPPSRAPRRFACAIAAGWLIGTGALFHAGITIPALALGGAFVAVAALVALTDVCIPSMMYRVLFRCPVRG